MTSSTKSETRYQRIAREQAERQAARKHQRAAEGKARKPHLQRDPYANTYMRDPDGYDRDNLGESPDY